MKFYLCLTALLIMPLALTAQDVRVVTEAFYPLNYLDETGEVTGQSTDAVKKLLNHSGLSYSINLYDWPKSYRIALSEPNTLIYSTVRSPEREKLFHWICPIGPPVKLSVFSLANDSISEVKSIEELKHYPLAVNKDTHAHLKFKRHGLVDGIHLHATVNNYSNLNMLLKGRVRLIAESKATAYATLAEHGLPTSTLKSIYEFDLEDKNANCLAINKDTDLSILNRLRESHKALFQKK